MEKKLIRIISIIIIIGLLFSLLFSAHIWINPSLESSVKIKNNDSTFWYTGIIEHGKIMPIKENYEADMFGNSYGNQIQPLLLSNQGEVIWSEAPVKIKITKNRVKAWAQNDEKVIYRKVGNTLKDAYQFSVQNYFHCSGRMPDSSLLLKPQYNTWIELMYNQNQTDILKYSKSILQNGFPTGVLMIDDNWQEDYGKWDFHPGRFSNPSSMVNELHREGFKVMLWVCPFISPDNDVFRELESKDFLLKDQTGLIKMVRWWNGVSALLDLSNPLAMEWFKIQLNNLIKKYKIDGYKFDAGDPKFYIDVKGLEDISPNEYTKIYASIGLDYKLNEYRANWKMGGQPLANRLRDKNHSWEDLKTLIPNMIVEGLMGYSYACPDMIGGGESSSFIQGKEIDQELIVRSAQCHALMPMMQFSLAPWRVLDSLKMEAVKKALLIRKSHLDYLMRVVGECEQFCSPILRSMEYSFPHSGYEKINTQFLIGDSLLVCPVLEKNLSVQDVIIPKGKWKGFNGKIYKGSNSYKFPVTISDLPYFERIE